MMRAVRLVVDTGEWQSRCLQSASSRAITANATASSLRFPYQHFHHDGALQAFTLWVGA
jgi:hypothetical protein